MQCNRKSTVTQIIVKWLHIITFHNSKQYLSDIAAQRVINFLPIKAIELLGVMNKGEVINATTIHQGA